MKTSLKIFLFLVVALGFSATAMAQNTDTETANASVTLVSTLSVTKTSDMSFGNIIPSSTLGTVTLAAADGARTAGGGVTLPTTVAGTPATFTISATNGSIVNITVPSSITLSGTGADMTVSNIEATPGSGLYTMTSSSVTLKIGGKLNVAASQAVGSYTGTFNVTAAYN